MSEVRVLAWWLLVRPPPGSQVGWVGLEGGQTLCSRKGTDPIKGPPYLHDLSWP